MSRQTTWIVIVALILLIAGFYYWRYQTAQTSQNQLKAEQQAVNDLNSALEQNAPKVEVPSTNPLEALPKVNPIEQTNPFKNVYKNPFQ